MDKASQTYTWGQTLHGYDRGHRLLAANIIDLKDGELALLDRLSDLSGYLPSGLDFDHYHTGFPCGRYYAFASTWLDTQAARSGTVLTHTLLIPLARATAMEDLFAASAMFRRPFSAEDREPYSRQVLMNCEAPATQEIPDATARQVTGLWFGQSDRPVLWLSPDRPEPVVRYLWRKLHPAMRQRFAFCTLALQERTANGRLFDFLGVPPEAEGAFHSFARKRSWWPRDVQPMPVHTG